MADLGRSAPIGSNDLIVGNGQELPPKITPSAEDIAASVGNVYPGFKFPELTANVRERCSTLLSQ